VLKRRSRQRVSYGIKLINVPNGSYQSESPSGVSELKGYLLAGRGIGWLFHMQVIVAQMRRKAGSRFPDAALPTRDDAVLLYCIIYPGHLHNQVTAFRRIGFQFH
jgi:hypothetical protein